MEGEEGRDDLYGGEWSRGEGRHNRNGGGKMGGIDSFSIHRVSLYPSQ